MARAALNRCETFPVFTVDDLTKLRNEAPKGEVQASETSDEKCQPRLTPSHWCIDRNQDLEDKVKRLQDNQQQSYGLRMAWWICWFATFLHGLEVSNTFFKVCWRLLACALRISMLKHRPLSFSWMIWSELNFFAVFSCVLKLSLLLPGGIASDEWLIMVRTHRLRDTHHSSLEFSYDESVNPCLKIHFEMTLTKELWEGPKQTGVSHTLRAVLVLSLSF